MPSVKFITGDVRDALALLPDESVHCVVTSPPYWGLRDYGVPGQLGLEPTPAEYVANMVRVFAEVRRVLRDDGTLWLNLGDSYWRNPKRGNQEIGAAMQHKSCDLAEKNLLGVPWLVAFALQADSWILRQDIIWAKPNPMPESVRDRCTKAHEYLFLLAKSERYYFDAGAIAEPAAWERWGDQTVDKPQQGTAKWIGNKRKEELQEKTTRNKRSVWTVATKPFKGAHFATFPPDLIEPCILAGCPADGTVLDPFSGAGTTGLVARRNNRNAILVELNPAYVDMAKARLAA